MKAVAEQAVTGQQEQDDADEQQAVSPSRAPRASRSRAARVVVGGAEPPEPAPRSARGGSRAALQEPPSTRNEVLLVGRLPAEALDRELPSGDTVTTWRLVVDRVPPARTRARAADEPVSRSATVDALDCATWSRAVRRTLMGCQPGDVLEVTGSLHRRFWRSPNGPASRYEVDVVTARRVHRG